MATIIRIRRSESLGGAIPQTPTLAALVAELAALVAELRRLRTQK